MPETLDSIAGRIRICTQCPLSRRRTHAVPGEGNVRAEIFFVGEGPGKREDELGRPFVGAAGRILDSLLAFIGLGRDDVFIGNVVKCRPPGNRDPEEAEIAVCASLYLGRQIALVKPKLIIPLGRYAMRYFLPNDLRISEVHGQAYRRKGQVYYPLYHTATVLYSNSMMKVMQKDFKRIPKLLEQIKSGEVAQMK